MLKFGAKLFSNNFIDQPELAKECVRLVEDGTFDFLEIMALPDSYAVTKDVITDWVKGRIKVVIHAPHQGQGMDIGNKKAYQHNRQLLDSAQRYADLLDSEIIILHGGSVYKEGVDELVRQYRMIADERIALENLPYYWIERGVYFQGNSPAAIAQIKAETGCKFCYDFCHGVCASCAAGRDRWQDVADYAALKPDMYHLCDSDWNGTNDEHKHFGEGNYDLARLLSYCPDNSLITMETGHGLPRDMSPWVKDVKYLRGLKIS